MENRYDFVKCLAPDATAAVLARLDNAADLVRASAVSRTWRQFVIESSSCKKLALRLYPETSAFAQIIEVNGSTEEMIVSRNSTELEALEKEHKIYAFLGHCLNSRAARQECTLLTIGASSTDNYPDESIVNTLVPNNVENGRPSYWSSKGQRDPQVPETLTYRLNCNLCIINQINISPFQAYFQRGHPIYSAQAVRFRMGYSSNADKPTVSQQTSCDDYIWTYVSPMYSMLQEYDLQSFMLPRPVLCTGGILQIEFLGRVQQQEMDGLYYICVCYVQVLGRQLAPVLDTDHFDNTKELALKYLPQALISLPNEEASENEETDHDADGGATFGWNAFAERLRRRAAMFGWNDMVLGTYLRADIDDDDSDDEPLA